MTTAPADLKACQLYLHARTGQPWDALGIIHGSPQGGGYHEGNDLLSHAGRLDSDYSKRESPRDRPGTDSASALDIGGDFGGFRLVTRGLVAACERGDPRTRDIREVIYTPDGATVKRWDRLRVRSGGDDSHLGHTHISFFRDSEGRRDQSDNFLGLLRALFEGDDMTPEEHARLVNIDATVNALIRREKVAHLTVGDQGNTLDALLVNIAADAKAAASLPTVVTLTDADRAAIVEQLKASIPTAGQIADELAKRLGNG